MRPRCGVRCRGPAPHDGVISDATPLSSTVPAQVGVQEIPLWLKFSQKPPTLANNFGNPASGASSAASNRAPTLEQSAGFGEHRHVGDVAAFALPGGVPTARTRHASDEHVSGQQPVAAHAAVRSCVHLVSPNGADADVDINNHNHHTGIPRIANTGWMPDRYGLVSCRGRVAVPMGAPPAVSH